jgi:secreted Zn-dependent insulinase-like peptidase
MDRSFLIPKINVQLNLITQYLRTTPKDFLTLFIFKNYLTNSLESEFSELKDTGGEINLTFNENGYTIGISIFSDLVVKITERLMSIIYSPNIKEADFKQYLETSIDQLQDDIENQPFRKAQDIFKKIIKHNVSSKDDLLSLLTGTNNSTLTYADFNTSLQKILPSITLNSLFYGYLKKELLNDVVANVFNKYLGTDIKEVSDEDVFNVNNPVETKLSIFKLSDYLHTNKIINTPLIYRTINKLPNEHNHLVYNYFQVGIRDYKTSLVMNIMEMIWGNMFYNSLRTVSQLGYIVSANKELIDNYMYFSFIVQGGKENPANMNLEIDKVLSNLRDKIVALSEEKFNEIKTSLKNELQSKDTNLKERTQRIWNEIYLNTLDFRRKENLIQIIPEVSMNDILVAYDNIFVEKPRKISIQIYAGNSDSSVVENPKDEIYYLNSNIVVKVKTDLNNILEN